MDDNDDNTVLMPGTPASTSTKSIRLSYFQGDGQQQRTMAFSRAFTVGREESCDVSLQDNTISREHVRIYLEGTQWQFEDLKSTNGTYIDNQLILSGPVESRTVLQLGVDGPYILLEPPAPVQPPKEQPSDAVAEVARRYFEADGEAEAGEHTMLVRRAFKQAKKKHTQRYVAVISFVVVLLISSLSVVFYQRDQLAELKELTLSVFYDMKALEIQMAKIETNIDRNTELSLDANYPESRQLRVQLAEMELRYDTFLQKLGVFEKNMSEEERLILKMARVFGECEVDMPADFVAEVRRYIKKWQSTARLKKSIVRALDKGYPAIVKAAMLEYHLPPQFFYLALQESSFKAKTVGPPTRFGLAKGMWQFIPATARRYGLQTGPLLELPRYDPRDERFHFESATRAAARYLRDIYATEAQASGLLVVASYNLGENRVKELILQLPENPRERNFWALLKKYKIPKETYDYVFYIFSAAVIGENPGLFGFEFNNPLDLS